MKIFGYTPAQIAKALTSGIFAVGAIVGLFVTVDPNLVQAITVLGLAVLSTVVVFGTKNHTVDDYSKAINQLEFAGIAVVGYFATVPQTTSSAIIAATGAVISAISVLFIPNATKTAR